MSGVLQPDGMCGLTGAERAGSIGQNLEQTIIAFGDVVVSQRRQKRLMTVVTLFPNLALSHRF
jgi:hypothetical protein